MKTVWNRNYLQEKEKKRGMANEKESKHIAARLHMANLSQLQRKLEGIDLGNERGVG